MKGKIFFRYTSDYYGCFGNFSKHSLIYDNKLWATSEAAYQAAKFIEIPIKESIRMAASPYEAKKIGRAHKITQPNWEAIKVGVMKDILRQKAKYNKVVSEKLLETGDAEIIGISAKDTFWEVSPLGVGENQLGKLWMEIRKELQDGTL